MARKVRQEIPNRFLADIPQSVIDFYEANADGFRDAAERFYEVTDLGNVVVVWGDSVFDDELDGHIDDMDHAFVYAGVAFAYSQFGSNRVAIIADPRV